MLFDGHCFTATSFGPIGVSNVTNLTRSYQTDGQGYERIIAMAMTKQIG